MHPDLVFLPKPIPILSLIIILLSCLKELRQGYIGRIGIAANAFLLWQIFFNAWDRLPTFFQWYLNIGTVVGIIAIISYISKESLPSEFYDFCYIFYGSLSILLTIIFAIELGIPLV